MATKSKKTAEKKAAPAKAEKAEKKSAKAPKGEDLEMTSEMAAAAAAAQEELEEQEEQAAATKSGGAGVAAAALAAASSTEMSASFKNFRHHPDMENFYRFIYENDLRLEALHMINDVLNEKQMRKAVKHAKTQAH